MRNPLHLNHLQVKAEGLYCRDGNFFVTESTFGLHLYTERQKEPKDTQNKFDLNYK